MTQKGNKVRAEDFPKAILDDKPTVRQLMRSFPRSGVAADFLMLIDLLKHSKKMEWPVVLGVGGHVVKCGLSRFIIELMGDCNVQAVCMPGSTAIHDYEIATMGETSQDVAHALKMGNYGSRVTASKFVEMTADAVCYKSGLGWGIGRGISQYHLDHKKLKGPSILETCFRREIAATVHVAIGTDTVHVNPAVSGAEIGEASFRDFLKLCNVISKMRPGGIFVCFGSAVILPEVFLKAVTYCRQELFVLLDNLHTAVFDFNLQYREMENVVKRPAKWGAYFVGQHELMIPLLSACLKAK